jgi:UDPglucose--hexose-1-phosphate uridylyltransferase
MTDQPRPAMPEDLARAPHRRYDPLRDEWVLVSAGRTSRPWLGRREPEPAATRPAYDPECYLCPGNRRASGEHNPPYTSTYVFTNDFAALRPDTPLMTWDDGLLRAEGQQGTSRVLCFSPRHDLTLTSMPPEGIRAVVDMWADQTTELGERFRWVQVFENRGAEMGASNPHPHGQIWAGTALPGSAAREEATQRRHHEATGRRLVLDVAAQEAGGPRIVDTEDGWLALVPFWAVWPYELLLVPLEPAARVADLDGPARDALARILQRLMARYDALFDRPFPFSFGWHQAPFDGRGTEHWQLHAHFYPPLLGAQVRKFMVGYELLSEPQRDITAEDAADRLRAVTLAGADASRGDQGGAS